MSRHATVVRKTRLMAMAAIGVLALTQSVSAYDTTAATAAANSSVCDDARPFYWEIGGESGSPIVSGQVGGTDFSRTSVIAIASASKWIFGAYVVERYGGIPGGAAGAEIVNSLAMLEGHTLFNPLWCDDTMTVSECHEYFINDWVLPGRVGSFNYGGGDGQYAAADAALLDLGDMYVDDLIDEVSFYLDLDEDFSYGSPGVSGGMGGTAAGWAEFLQRIMDGTYEMSNYLDYSPVETVCEDCDSPLGDVPMHYSLNHWIEDNETGGTLPVTEKTLGPGDGSYSSPGGYGFYPWITADLQYYGIIARQDSQAGAHEDSIVCGQAIRAAFLD